MLAQVRKKRISQSYPSRRETDGTGSGPLYLSSHGIVAFVACSRHSLWYRRRSSTCVPSFCAPQASAAYKYPAIGPEKKLDREQRAQHLNCFCYSNFSCTFASLQNRLFQNFLRKRECCCNWEGDNQYKDSSSPHFSFLQSSTCAFNSCL